MVERLKTKIHGLDKVLGGGIPFRTNILLLGKPGTGKSTFCFQVAKNALDEGLSCLFVATTSAPREILNNIKSFGFDVERYIEDKRLVFIDCYSSRLGTSKDKFEMIDASNLNALSLEIEKELKSIKKPFVLIFDSFSEVLLRNDLDKSSKFLSVISAKVKMSNSIGVISLVEDMHDEKTRAAVEFLCDGTIKMSVGDEKRFIHVSRMKITVHPLEKFEFSIEGKGITLTELEEFFEY